MIDDTVLFWIGNDEKRESWELLKSQFASRGTRAGNVSCFCLYVFRSS